MVPILLNENCSAVAWAKTVSVLPGAAHTYAVDFLYLDCNYKKYLFLALRVFLGLYYLHCLKIQNTKSDNQPCLQASEVSYNGGLWAPRLSRWVVSSSLITSVVRVHGRHSRKAFPNPVAFMVIVHEDVDCRICYKIGIVKWRSRRGVSGHGSEVWN